MHQMNVSDAKDFVQHIAYRMGYPVMLWGSPGVAKSELNAQVARANNALFLDVRLGQYDSVDLRGIPAPDAETSMTIWYPPSTLPFKSNPAFDAHKGPIHLFLDEINSAIPAVAGVAYQLINDRRVGEHELRDNVVIVAAGNREGDRGVVNRMPLPLCNRFVHGEVIAEADDVVVYFQSKGVEPVILAFLQFRKPLLNTFDPSKPDKAFATPRTWEKAATIYADDKMGEKTKMAAMAGTIGDGPSTEFWGFVDIWHKMIPLKDILKDPKNCRLPEEPSMAYAVAVNVSGAMDRQQVNTLHTYLDRLDPEYVVLAWSLAVKRDPSLFGSQSFVEFAKKYKVLWQQ